MPKDITMNLWANIERIISNNKDAAGWCLVIMLWSEEENGLIYAALWIK
jgi:hypothetical protein